MKTRSTPSHPSEVRPMRPREGLVVATGIFAGIAVDDYGKALEWYRRLLGAEPSFYPNDVEAVWQLAEDRFVYIIVDADGPVGRST